MTAHADYRQRSQIEITRDLIAACRRIGDIGLQSEMAMTPPDAGELTRAHEAWAPYCANSGPRIRRASDDSP